MHAIGAAFWSALFIVRSIILEEVNAVVHSHSPTVIPFGVTQAKLRPVSQMGSFLAPGVPVFEIRDAGGMTDLLVRDNPLGGALAEVLSQKPAALLRGHGSVVVGATN